MTSDLEASVAPFVRAALGKKADRPVALDVRSLTSIADVFLILSGRSNRQVSAIADFIRRNLKEKGIKPLHVEGMKEGHWILLDYGHIIIHVFYEPVRDEYDLEGLWLDAARIDLKPYMTMSETRSTGENVGAL